METLTGALLRDMSGNGNDGTFSGGMTYSGALTGGLVGKGLGFTNNSTGCIYIVDNAPTLTGSSFTIETIVKIISLDTADLNYIF